MSTEQCPACSASQFDSPEGISNPICAECGLVISDDVEPPTEPPEDPAADEESISWSEFYTVTNETERQVAQAHEHLEQLKYDLRLTVNAIAKASDILLDAAIENLADGRSWEIIAAATVCVGARLSGEYRPSGKVAEAANVQKAKLQQTIRLLQRHLELDPVQNSADELLPFLCDELGLASEVRDRSERILQSCNNAFASRGVDPVSIAGAAVYIAADDVTQREVANSLSITQETIRVRVGEIQEVGDEVVGNA